MARKGRTATKGKGKGGKRAGGKKGGAKKGGAKKGGRSRSRKRTTKKGGKKKGGKGKRGKKWSTTNWPTLLMKNPLYVKCENFMWFVILLSSHLINSSTKNLLHYHLRFNVLISFDTFQNWFQK